MSSFEKALRKHSSATSQKTSESKSVRRMDFGGRAAASPDKGREVDQEKRTSLSPISVKLDEDELIARGLLPIADQAKHIQDQMRRIKRSLIRTMSIGDSGFGEVPKSNLILITSALSGDGKTFVSFNIARSISNDRDHTVLLIDGDVIKRDLTTSLGLESRTGLTDLLLDDRLDVGECMVKTDTPGLRVLPAGAPHEFDSELLASNSMHRLMREMSERYSDRVVIMDSAPVIQSPTAAAIAGQVGQVGFVIGAERTPQMAVLESLETLGDVCPIQLILNGASGSDWRGYNAGGYYGYGRGKA